MAIALAFLVSADEVAIQQFSHALKELSISTDVCHEVSGPEIRSSSRYMGFNRPLFEIATVKDTL